MPRKKTDRLNITIDQTLKRQFDAICALKGLKMSETTQMIIRQWVEENAPPGLLGETEKQKPPSPEKKKGGKE
ncbi:MAG: hypothetical protein F6K31_44355 [Symploca sp. SIO2G7]|nr:hypothetical protein [Symploca sp. SIO2G7]